MKNLLFIAYFFPPIGGAGVQRSVKFVRYLPEIGFLPLVLTGPGPINDRWSPSDSTFLDEIPENVKIFRVSNQFLQKTNKKISRVKKCLFYPGDFSKWWTNEAYKTGVEILNHKKVDAIFATMSPFESATVATRLSKRFRIPWVADLRDPWALDEMQIYPSYFHWLYECHRMEALLSKASGIVMNTPEAKKLLLKYFPSLKRNLVTTITNGYDSADFENPIKQRNDGKFRIVHAGYLHTALGLINIRRGMARKFLGGMRVPVDITTRSHYYLLKALDIILNENTIPANGLEAIFVGEASMTDREIVNDSHCSELVHLTGHKSHSKTLDYVRTADLLFLPMHNLPPGHRASIVPAKTYEYMASGNPILAAVPDGDAKDLLRSYGNAHISAPDDIPGMVNTIQSTYSNWGKNRVIVKPDCSFIKKFERKILTAQLAKFLNQFC